MKQCTTCLETKPCSNFHKAANTRDGYHTKCKMCRCAALNAKRWSENETSAWRALRLAMIHELEHRGFGWCTECRTAKPAGEMERKTNPNWRSTRCKKCVARRAAKYYHEVIAPNPALLALKYEKNNSYQAVRRANYEAAFVEDVNRLTVWERDGGVCGICGEFADPGDWHLDHVVPLARGGTHEYSNVQVSHPACNRSKWAHIPEGVT